MAQKQILADRPVTQKTLLDRIQIEDFLTRCYYDLSVGKAHELAEYFTAGRQCSMSTGVAKGMQKSPSCISGPEGATRPPRDQYRGRRGQHDALTNPIINIEGERRHRAPDLDRQSMNEGVPASRRACTEQGARYSSAR